MILRGGIKMYTIPALIELGGDIHPPPNNACLSQILIKRNLNSIWMVF